MTRKVIYITLGLLTSMVALGLLSFGLWIKKSGVLELDHSRLATITDYQHSDNSLVFDRNGEKIGEFFSSYHVFIPYEKIPRQLIEAILSVEDRNFFEHKGIDPRGIARAGLAFLRTGNLTQGGSTITQQVVRNFLLSSEKTFERKIKEAMLALELERRLSKQKILEIYCNALFLGQGAYGVGAAAERHFARPLNELELHELALIAGLFQSPSRYNPHKAPDQAKRRQKQVLKAMFASGYLSTNDYRKALKKPLKFQSKGQLNTVFAPHYIDAIEELTEKLLTGKVKGQGLRIYTSLDLALQKDLNQVIEQSSEIFSKAAQSLIKARTSDEKIVEAAAIILDHKQGEVLAMSGGRDYARSQFNRAMKAKRAPGSVFKPVVYALALQSGLKWSDMSYISPVTIQDYRPQNHNADYLTESTYFKAFYQSMNTPVVEMGYRLGTKNVLELAHRMGIQSELKNQAGTLLGGSELTVMDMAAAYATIANNGVAREPQMIRKITNRSGEILYEAPADAGQKVLAPQIAYLLIDALRAVFSFGTANKYSDLASFAGGKTGTTDEAKDNWFCGMTPELTAVVWVGTDSNLAFSGSIAGSTLALPIWAELIKKARLRYPGDTFAMPVGIKTLRVNPQFGYLDPGGIDMSFIEGQEPSRMESSLSVVRDTGNFRDYLDR